MTNTWLFLCAELLPGSLIAFGLHFVFVKMRRSALNATNILGWILLTILTVQGAGLMYPGISRSNDPLHYMNGVMTAIGAMELALADVALFLGGVHAMLGRIPVRKIVGAIGLEVIVAVPLGYFLERAFLSRLANILPGVNIAKWESSRQSGEPLSGGFMSLVAVLLVLLLFRIGDSFESVKE